jgi:hypothetical protein
MIFRRYYTLQSSQQADSLKKNILGQHLKIHHLDFEIKEHNGDIKVIPHAENDDQVYTLPITRLRIIPKGNTSVVKMLSKPRRTDIGGPYLLLIFIFFALIAGVLLYFLGKGEYDNTAYILVGIALIVFALLWIRMERGYFDYIRKTRDWLKSHI